MKEKVQSALRYTKKSFQRGEKGEWKEGEEKEEEEVSVYKYDMCRMRCVDSISVLPDPIAIQSPKKHTQRLILFINFLDYCSDLPLTSSYNFK